MDLDGSSERGMYRILWCITVYVMKASLTTDNCCMLAATENVILAPPLDRGRGKAETIFDIFYCVIYILSDNV